MPNIIPADNIIAEIINTAIIVFLAVLLVFY